MPPNGGMAPPPLHMDQFSPPPMDMHNGSMGHEPEHAPPAHMPFQNGGPLPFDAFDPPMPPPSFDIGLSQQHGGNDPNPLVAAMAADDPLPLPPSPPSPLVNHSPPPPRPQQAAAHGGGNGAKPPARKAAPDFSGLPPAMAESLAKLAGVPWPPSPDGEQHEFEPAAGSGKTRES